MESEGRPAQASGQWDTMVGEREDREESRVEVKEKMGGVWIRVKVKGKRKQYEGSLEVAAGMQSEREREVAYLPLLTNGGY